MKITVTTVGCTLTTLQGMLNTMQVKVQKGMYQLAGQTQSHMRDIIKKNKRREGSTGNLENSIRAEKTVDGWGVGNITTMSQEAPYWRLMNYGGMVSPKARIVPGFFGNRHQPIGGLKGTNVGREQFYYTPRGIRSMVGGESYWLMKVDNPIEGMLYIEKTFGWLNTQVAPKFRRWTSTTQGI